MACLIKGRGGLTKCSKTNYYKSSLFTKCVQIYSLISIYNGPGMVLRSRNQYAIFSKYISLLGKLNVSFQLMHKNRCHLYVIQATYSQNLGRLSRKLFDFLLNGQNNNLMKNDCNEPFLQLIVLSNPFLQPTVLSNPFL